MVFKKFSLLRRHPHLRDKHDDQRPLLLFTPIMSSYGASGPPPASDRIEILRRDEAADFPVARSVDHLLIPNRNLNRMPRSDSCKSPQPTGSFAAGAFRRPYVFNRSRTTSMASVASDSTQNDFRQHNMAIRYRFFNRLDPAGETLLMPDHVYVPGELFSILPFDDFKDDDGKQGSLVTIFSLWNTMMGTSLLAMPWALQQAGLALGLFLIVAMALVACYTAYRVIESPRALALDVDAAQAEFSDVCRYFWGKRGEYTAVFFSIVVLLGGVIVYFVLMSNFLYYTGNIVYESLQPNSTTIPVLANKTFTCDIYYDENCKVPKDEIYEFFEKSSLLKDDDQPTGFWTFDNLWRLQGTVPFILAFLTFPLMNFKSPTFFTKFNVLGTVSVFYLIGFVISKAIECRFNVNWSDPHSLNYVKLWDVKFPALTGTLALSYFIHNAVLTILRNQKRPENNARDLTIGFFLAMLCYLTIGVLFFLAFPGKRDCISDNFLNNFGSGDVMSAVARLFLLFQMISVLPLLMYLIRVQWSYVFTGVVYPGLGYTCLINLSVITVAVFFAVIYPHVGSILRYVGSFSGMVYIFSLPCFVHLKRLQQAGALTTTQLVVHGLIVLVGLSNLISQFVV